LVVLVPGAARSNTDQGKAPHCHLTLLKPPSLGAFSQRQRTHTPYTQITLLPVPKQPARAAPLSPYSYTPHLCVPLPLSPQAGVARVAAGGGAPGDGPSEGAPRIHSMNVGAGGAGEMQALEEQRLAAIESPAGRRETLGDKVRHRQLASSSMLRMEECKVRRFACFHCAAPGTLCGRESVQH
jgi:hypothetical protein